MPTVTALEAHQRKKDRVKLYLDDEYAMDLPLKDAVGLSPGQPLTDAEIEALGEAGALQSAVDRAVRYLASRPRSREEVRRHLVKKGMPGSLVAAAIDRLQQHGYVDDAAFAEFWLANRDRFKPMAPRALRYELRQKGLADEIIDRALARVDAADAAYRAAQGRAPRFRGRSRDEFRHKTSAMLRRRGFSTGTIIDAVLRLQRELEETEPGYFRSDTVD